MKIENWITIGSALMAALIVAIGWLVTGYLNRRKDVAQRRLEYRQKALESFLPVFFKMQQMRTIDEEIGRQLGEARSKFLLYGYKDERDAMEKFVRLIEAKDLAGTNRAMQELIDLTVKKIRSELEISD